MSRVIGVLGGMGPEATADFFVKLIRLTPARCDAEHLHVVIDSNPQIPDRTAFIERKGPSPLPLLVAAARRLVDAGADLLVMPCITAHLFIDEIRDA
ncbi:MAG TPA: aspartate/glutamate racemase family protein, partial [Planctomycetota bacterium]|nr:aspartate/glutamate racemase family protein [Planctomycetota bacterium]